MVVATSLLASKASFDQLDLDSRLLRAIAKLGFKHPTLVQHTAIPLALQGKDIVARARTGSGKTAAYCLPIINKILARHQMHVTAAGGVDEVIRKRENGREREGEGGRETHTSNPLLTTSPLSPPPCSLLPPPPNLQ